MANKKISQLDAASAAANMVIPASDAAGTVTNKVTVQSILNLASGTVTVKPDPYTQCSLLLHMNGSGNTFVDYSPLPKTVTANGNVTQSSTQSKFGGTSAYFDGSGDYLEIADHPAFDFGFGDFVVEAWIYVSSLSSDMCIASKYKAGINATVSAWQLVLINDGSVGANICIGSTEYGGAAPIPTPYANQWNHVALVRNGNVASIYWNGTLLTLNSGSTLGSINGALNIVNDVPVRIGARGYAWGNPPDLNFNGYIDEVRITKGSSLGYTGATITVPTAPHPDAAASQTLPIVGTAPPVASWSNVPASPTSAGNVGDVARDASGIYVCTATNTWSKAPLSLNWDAHFAQVPMLLHFNGAGMALADSSLAARAVTAYGQATQSTTQARWGGASLHLTGAENNGGHVTFANAADLDFGSGDWVIEFWMYTSAQAFAPILQHASLPNTQGWVIWNYDVSSIGIVTRKIGINVLGKASIFSSGDAYSDNTWTHIAAVRSGNTLSLYSAGTRVATDSISGPITRSSTTPKIGWLAAEDWSSGIANYYWNGYIDDVRITVGSDRGYTGSTIAVPTAAFPDL